ncbi:LppU/SCO3897 family protein [Micromonospora citrea]|uniref:LppU/SCO3897 family protein n=1 Tax=Micromonospora citrea TaxID=47855 RepID=UPI003C47F670
MGDPTPPRPKRRGPLVAVLAVLAAVVLGGAGVLWLLSGREEAATPVAGSAAPPVTVDPVRPGPGGPAPTTPAPASSSDPRFVAVGQCVRNDGPAGGRPRLLIAECGSGTYEVLRRFDGETSGERDAEAKCGQVAGYSDWFFYDSELDSLDFVLCLRKR